MATAQILSRSNFFPIIIFIIRRIGKIKMSDFLFIFSYTLEPDSWTTNVACQNDIFNILKHFSEYQHLSSYRTLYLHKYIIFHFFGGTSPFLSVNHN